MYQDKTNIT